MQLASGTRLGSYEIVSPIGAGGMGEVYRARDTRLNRDVAIKVLPEVFAADPDRLARFEREAQTLAALNHPNIAHIHGVADLPTEAGGQTAARALVMEFVEGEDLAQRLARGPLPLDESVAIARQIADALEAAHERGIIHRDLKPANVKVAADGTVKVLDFGLAKALDPIVGTTTSAMNSPTFTSPAMTHMGVILGTAGYMSPEQAKGKPVDRRADIWALGVVLFEMLTGRMLYVGETVTETIAQVITQPANLDALPPSTPASVRRILRRCLEKDPRKRFHSAGDVRIELEELSEDQDLPASAFAKATADKKGGSYKGPSWAPWAAAAFVGLLALAAIVKTFGEDAPPAAPGMRLDVRIAEGAPIFIDDNIDGAVAVISPDGQTICYLGATQNTRRLYIRRLDAAESTALSGTDDATSQFFSPDGKWIGFFANGELKKVAVSGGAPVTITAALDARGGTWGPDDTIVFTPTTGDGLHRVAASGGTSEAITTRNDKERTHRWPSFVPGTDLVLFISQNHDAAYDDGMIEVVNVKTKARKILVRGGTFPRYLAPGYLTYVRENAVFAVPFDVKALDVGSSAQPILSSVLASHGIGAGVGDGAAQIAFSNTGTAVLLGGAVASPTSKLVVTDRTGKVLYAHPDKAEFRSPRFSPDGSRIAVQMVDGRINNIFILDIARGTLTKASFDGTMNGTPAWSRDGKLLAYYSDRQAGGLNLFTIRSDGAGEPAKLTDNLNINVPSSFSPDDTLIAGMQQATSGGGLDLVIFSRPDKKIIPFVSTPAQEVLPDFSPDGNWIAYSSDETGRPEVYVRPYPQQAGRWILSNGGGLGPVWTKNGKEIIYVGLGTGRVFAVDVDVKGGAIQQGKPQMLFELPIATPPNASWMDATSDGAKIVLLRDDDRSGRSGYTHVTLITNFTEQVRKVVGEAR